MGDGRDSPPSVSEAPSRSMAAASAAFSTLVLDEPAAAESTGAPGLRPVPQPADPTKFPMGWEVAPACTGRGGAAALFSAGDVEIPPADLARFVALVREAVRDGAPDAQRSGGWMLANLTYTPESHAVIISASAVRPLVALVRGGAPDAQSSAIAHPQAIARGGLATPQMARSADPAIRT